MEEYPPLTFCETINTTNFNAFTLAQIANTEVICVIIIEINSGYITSFYSMPEYKSVNNYYRG